MTHSCPARRSSDLLGTAGGVRAPRPQRYRERGGAAELRRGGLPHAADGLALPHALRPPPRQLRLDRRGSATDELAGAMNEMWRGQAFTVSHADGGAFVGAGLRAFFEYRDLGIAKATGGKFGAHVIRAVPGKESPGAWHSHELE